MCIYCIKRWISKTSIQLIIYFQLPIKAFYIKRSVPRLQKNQNCFVMEADKTKTDKRQWSPGGVLKQAGWQNMTVANIQAESGWQVFHFVSMFQGLIEGESKVLKSLEIVFPFSLFSSLQLLSLFCKINFWLWCRVLKRNVKYVLGSKSGKL